jgi:hypothetical protein
VTDEFPTLNPVAEQTTEVTHLAHVSYEATGVQIVNETDEGLWIIVKSNSNLYKLSPNDVVKFGRVEYLVKDIKL